MSKRKALHEEKKSLDAFLTSQRAFDIYKDSLDRMTNAFKYDARIFVEVKGMGWGGEKPTEQTYREHMIRAYAYLGDFRNQASKQKYVIVPYKLVKRRDFNYDIYFRSINAFLLDYSNPKEKRILEDKIRRLKEETESKLEKVMR